MLSTSYSARTSNGSDNTLHWDGGLAKIHMVDGTAIDTNIIW